VELLRADQPSALLFNFPKQGGLLGAGDPQRNSGRWFGGNDAYNVTGPVWSTFCCDNPHGCITQTQPPCALNQGSSRAVHGFRGCVPGDARCNTFLPAAHEDVIQEQGHWFYAPTVSPRPVSEMIDVYHKTVARNVLLEIDFAIDKRGKIAPSHRRFYEEFGAFLRACYGSAVAQGSLSFEQAAAQQGSGAVFVEIDVGDAEIDRVVIEEDQTRGQRILEYEIVATDGRTFGNGTSVGSKRIAFADGPRKPSKLRLTVAKTAGGLPPAVTRFAAFRPCACPAGSPPGAAC